MLKSLAGFAVGLICGLALALATEQLSPTEENLQSELSAAKAREAEFSARLAGVVKKLNDTESFAQTALAANDEWERRFGMAFTLGEMSAVVPKFSFELPGPDDQNPELEETLKETLDALRIPHVAKMETRDHGGLLVIVQVVQPNLMTLVTVMVGPYQQNGDGTMLLLDASVNSRSASGIDAKWEPLAVKAIAEALIGFAEDWHKSHKQEAAITGRASETD